ncbi:hypothetical protein EFE27_01215 [Leuconostoc citreum]|uniref:hypothetical protein n=1 Tax=Leuconostoc citreum TaxID=33964 RepID=UPI002182198D|nr:hypothetical protein [Leuconostoc citreum]MCS8594612.1 hypothetical protein [Leuconostoc citreum]
MVLRVNDVVININSQEQEAKFRKILRPTAKDLKSREFNKRVDIVANGFIQARKGMDNLKKLLG